MSHVTLEQILRYFDGGLSTVDAKRVQKHLSSCSECQALERRVKNIDRLLDQALLGTLAQEQPLEVELIPSLLDLSTEISRIWSETAAGVRRLASKVRVVVKENVATFENLDLALQLYQIAGVPAKVRGSSSYGEAPSELVTQAKQILRGEVIASFSPPSRPAWKVATRMRAPKAAQDHLAAKQMLGLVLPDIERACQISLIVHFTPKELKEEEVSRPEAKASFLLSVSVETSEGAETKGCGRATLYRMEEERPGRIIRSYPKERGVVQLPGIPPDNYLLDVVHDDGIKWEIPLELATEGLPQN